jgi:pSer/pThr/pTyr-binding forkhead associated (FHA) protein
MGLTLIMTTASGDERSFAVPMGTTVIGRDSRCDLRIALPTVSKQHCAITFNEGAARIEHLAEDLQTLVNGESIAATPLAPADIVQIGPVIFRVESQDDSVAGDGRRISQILIERTDHSPS